mgnify:CR=1 FL=1
MTFWRARRFLARRGAALTVVLMTALFSAIAVYTLMLMTLSQARHATFFQDRAVAVNAAEAGLIWAQQQLWVTPTLCGSLTVPAALFDPPVTVTVNITDCSSPVRTLKAQVSY